MAPRLNRRIGPYREILRALWENRDRPRYAWRILNDGVCDGCALGTTGMRDWTMSGVHLCWIRLNLLRLNTMPACDPERLADAATLRSRSEQELRGLGRLPAPMLRQRGDAGFHRIGWDEALRLMADRIRDIDPRRLAFYVVSRGTANETYYAAQKAARALGTNHVDNSARICHSPSTVALKETLGFAATTCSYRDMMGTDLVVLIGSDTANNQPVMMKYLHLAREKGTRVAVINPFREPGLERYWVPSSVDSALRGTRIADAHFSIRVGGDIAFLNGVLKHLVENDWLDRGFIEAHTDGWAELERSLAAQTFEDLERESGATAAGMLEFARMYAGAKSAVLVWSMGVTMHRHGVDNVKAIVNLGLARGMVGRERTGLMPIRGHSGVQGGAEMGCVPNVFPGGREVDAAGAAALSELWGFPVPDWRGAYAADMIELAHGGQIDALYSVGGNFLSVLPDRDRARDALRQIPLRIHHDIVINPQMMVDPAEAVLLLPATTRYEMAGGNTETSTERRVIFNPEIPGPRVPEARDEWRVLCELAARVRPHHAAAVSFNETAEIRDEIARVIPQYDGIQLLRRKGDQFQWGGPRLGDGGEFGTANRRARFSSLTPPSTTLPPGKFHLNTRRGKQFNSMIFGEKDMLTGGGRNSVLVCAEDLKHLGLTPGAAVTVTSAQGKLRGVVMEGDVHRGTVIMPWPEANVLIASGVTEAQSGIPAYRDAVVELIPEVS